MHCGLLYYSDVSQERYAYIFLGNSYSLKNVGKIPAQLFYVAHKRVYLNGDTD